MTDRRNAQFELRDVDVSFADTAALAGVSLVIEPGELVAFVGASGAGKTTLLRLLNASVEPDGGAVAIEGRNPFEASFAELRRLRRRIGYIHQQLHLIPNLRVIHNVLFGRLGEWSLSRSLREFLFPSQAAVEEAYALLQRVGIGEKLYERTDRLSGGQQQRVAIARALFQKPRALIADEPVSSVDPARARDTISLLSDLARQNETTLCVSLHNFELACEFFPRLIGLHHGSVVFDCPPDEVSPAQRQALYRIETEEMLAHG